MNLEQLYLELRKALKYVLKEWGFQNNENDSKTNFIYNCDTFEEVLENCEKRNIDVIYAMHRWYNYKTSIYCEKIFCENGCVPNSDIKSKTIDLYHKSIPYDIKLTVYPKTIKEKINLNTREGKNKLIKWYYLNQSQQARKHLENRLFVVCVSDDYNQQLLLKSDFEKLKFKIKKYLEYYEDKELNIIKFIDNGKEIEVYSDIIIIT